MRLRRSQPKSRNHAATYDVRAIAPLAADGPGAGRGCIFPFVRRKRHGRKRATSQSLGAARVTPATRPRSPHIRVRGRRTAVEHSVSAQPLTSSHSGSIDVRHRTSPRRNVTLAVATAAVLLLALAACKAKSTPTENSKPSGPPQSGGSLTVLEDASFAGGYPSGLDPATNTTGGANISIQQAIYGGLFLIEANDDGTNAHIVPNQAESYTFSDSAKTLTIKLRPGIKFSDGTPFDSAAGRRELPARLEVPVYVRAAMGACQDRPHHRPRPTHGRTQVRAAERGDHQRLPGQQRQLDRVADRAEEHGARQVQGLRAGRMLAIIGESGSGKSVSSRAVMGLLPPTAQTSGSVRLGEHRSWSACPTSGCAAGTRHRRWRWSSRIRRAR